MRVVITGATGNLGTALVRRLLRTGDHEVVGLARRLPADRRAGEDADGRLAWAGVDLTCESSHATLRRAMRDADAVVHLAWGFQPSHDEGYLEELGVGGTRRVLAAVMAEEVPHLVHLSSVGAYAPRLDDQPVTEDYPATGVPTSTYSRHKAAAERLLDRFESAATGSPRPTPTITRIRPGIVGQRAAASALLRYGVPGFVPGRAVGWLPVLPLDRRLALQMVHADDVAAAVEAVLERVPGGAFNLAAAPVLGVADLAAALGARAVHVPARALHAAVSLSWRARLQPLDPGWVDLAMAVPTLDTSRARELLGWSPLHDAGSVLAETVDGLRDSAVGATPVLRARTLAGQLGDLVRSGPITRRARP